MAQMELLLFYTFWGKDHRKFCNLFPVRPNCFIYIFAKAKAFRQSSLIFLKLVLEPWSSDHGRRLMFKRLRVKESQHWLLDGHFFTRICCKNCIVCLKRAKIYEKDARDVKLKKILSNIVTHKHNV